MKKGTSVFGILNTRLNLEDAVDQLKSSGFSNNDISALLPDRDSTRDFAHEKNTKAPEGAATGAGTGAVLGGALGWLAGVGMLAIPGVGPFIAAGPIMSALAGLGIGSAVGGISGALIGLGMPEFEAKRYENKVHGGGFLLSVHTENRDQVHLAKDILSRNHAEDISTAGESKAPEKREPQTRDIPVSSSRTPKPSTFDDTSKPF